MAQRSEPKVKDHLLMRRIGLRILLARENKGLTQEVLAGLSGITEKTLGNAENGRGISLSSLLKISSALDVSLEYFI
jgi:transcriptional regulator with XRE-family HTH domain